MGAQQDAMKVFLSKIKTASKITAKKDGLDIIFVDNSVLFAKKSKDVTSSVMSNMG